MAHDALCSELIVSASRWLDVSTKMLFNKIAKKFAAFRTPGRTPVHAKVHTTHALFSVRFIFVGARLNKFEYLDYTFRRLL